MYTGHLTCPRCGHNKWHRDQRGATPTGVLITMLVCVRCSERLEVRHDKADESRYVVCRRWSLYDMGKLNPQYREWVHREPEGIPFYKGGGM